jgi:hypothetical protein
MSTLVSIRNRYGATLVTCEAHREQEMQFFFGAPMTEEPAGEDGICQRCDEQRKHAALPARFVKAALAPEFAYARQGSRVSPWDDTIHVYHRDRTSPSGVRLAASLDQARYRGLVEDGAIRELSALSPTERA